MREEKGIQFGRWAKLCAGLMALVLIGVAAMSSTAYAASVATKPDLEGYNGPDAQYIINPLPNPKLKPGYKFKVGYLNPFAGLSVILAMQKGCEQKVKAMGGEFIAYDAAGDMQKMVSQLDLLIAQKVDLIIANGITDMGLNHSVLEAKRAGIPVILINLPSSSDSPLDPNAAAGVAMAWDQYTWATMKYTAKKYPNGKISLIGFGPPSENLVYIMLRARYWAKEMGVNILGQTDAMDPSPNAGAVAAQALMARYPDMQGILTFNDYATAGAVGAIKAAGKTGLAVGNFGGGSDISVPGLKNGSIFVAYRAPWEKMGATAAIAGYDILTKQALPPRRMQLIGEPATIENVKSISFVH